MIKTKQDIMKEEILAQMLKLVPLDGWNTKTLEKSCVHAGYNKGIGTLLFEDGVDGIIKFFIEQVDSAMLEKLSKLDLAAMKVRDRIRIAVEIRLRLYQKDIVSKIVARASLHPKFAADMLSRTADLIWKKAGLDTTTDFNYYTKRMLLASVYSSTLIFWLSDRSDDYCDTMQFLERRINDVMGIGKFLSKFKGTA